MKFVSLHGHTSHSAGDGHGSPYEHALRAKELGMGALALTEHGNVSSHVQLEQACNELGIKPIFGCLPPGAMIHTKDGVSKIEEISEGDLVWTHKGRLRKVIRKMSRDFSGDMFTFEVGHGNRKVSLTGEHPVLVADKNGETRWVKAEKLIAGYRSKRTGIESWNSYAVVPKTSAMSTYPEIEPVTDAFPEKDFYRTDGTDYFGKMVKPWRGWGKPLVLDERFARFLGLFVAEGSISSAGSGLMTLTFHEKEKDYSDFCSSFLDDLGIYSRTYHRPSRKTLETAFCHVPFSQLLARHCGVGQKNRHVPEALFGAPVEVIEAFLRGLTDGDGKWNDDKENLGQLKTSSIDLAWGVKLLAANIGSFGLVQTIRSLMDGREFEHYGISVNFGTKWKRTLDSEDFVLVPIKRISSSPWKGTVHNIEVEEDNSYITDVVLHNCEAYVAPPKTQKKFHQTILAINEQGYRQLNKLVSMSYEEGFYYDPTVHSEWLLDPSLTSDLLILSGCADSWLSCTLAGGKSLGPKFGEMSPWDELPIEENLQKATSLAEDFQEVYGDRYFLEVQRFKNYDRTCFLNSQVRQISAELDIPMVATADVHYPHKEDWEVQRLSNAIAWGTTVEQLAEGRDYEASPVTFPASDKEMVLDLMGTGLTKQEAVQAVKNTAAVADRLNVTLPKTEDIRFSGSVSSQQSRKLLLEAIKDGVKYRRETSSDFNQHYEENKDDYKARIKKELETILPKNFADYFLINKEIIGWAKDSGIVVGPGRGSAAGSLVCYLLRLTEVNPMKFPMMVFERFLDPGRSDAPDIDTDYQDDRRNEVFDYAREKYGVENVGNIGNFSRFRGKSAVKSAAKALGIEPWVAENYCEYISEAPFGDPREFQTAEDAAEAFPEAKEILEENPDLRLAFELEGDQRSLGIHAAGMVLSNEPIYNTCAIYKRTKSNGEEAEVIAYDKRDAEYLNMLKLDCLGLLTMTIVADTINLVDDLDLETLYNLPLDDEKVLKAFADDDLTGIFQFEGRATRTVVRDIFSGTDNVPEFMTLADINALSRPGSLVSGMTRQYIDVERGAEPKSIHPVVDEILSTTNGCLVYQEQVMKIGQAFGGLDDTEIGRLRKIIGAKQAGGAFDEFWFKFRDGAKKLHGVGEGLARQVWDYMAASSSYLFNVAHAISYAIVAYWTMYLKVYHPTEFFASSLRTAAKKGKVKGKADPQLLLLQDAVQHGLTVSPPSPALSGVTWNPNREGTGLIGGFSQLPKIGLKTAERMVAYRNDNKIGDSSFRKAATWDFFVENTSGFGAKAADTARKMSEKADPFGINLTNNATQTVIDAIHEGQAPLELPDATSATIPSQDGDMVTYLGHVVSVKLVDVIGEKRQRDNMTTDEVIASMNDPELTTKAKIICSDPGGTEVHVNVNRYKYPQLKSEIDEIGDGVYAVHVMGRANNGFGPSVQAERLIAIELVEES